MGSVTQAQVRFFLVSGRLATGSRAAYSEGFRAPNLTQLHIPAITVVNSVNDPVTGYSGGIEERRTGNEELEPEESENISVGFVLTPDRQSHPHGGLLGDRARWRGGPSQRG